MTSRPPNAPLGDHMSVTLDIAMNGHRHRETDEVTDIVGRWSRRWVERRFGPMGYRCEGWSTRMEPGRTYHGWWFGDSEVYLYRD